MATTPFEFCGKAAASGTNPQVVNVTTSTQEGDTLLLAVAASSAASIPNGISDTQGNTWNLKQTEVTNLPYLYVYECVSASALSSVTPDQITVSYNATGSACDIIGVDVPNLPQASDKLVFATATTGSPSISTGVLTSKPESIVMFESHLAAGGVPAYGAPWTSMGYEYDGSASYLSAAYDDVTATTAVTAAATITSTHWSVIAVSYPAAPLVVSSVLSGAIQNHAYSQALTALGGTGAYTWAVTSGTLPTGLTLASGVISGTPTVVGTTTFTVTATDGASNTGSAVLSITVTAQGAASVNAFGNIGGNGNMLSVADQGGESGSISWVADLNAGAPAIQANAYLDGTHAIAWQATAAGNTSIHTGTYAVTGSKGYIASAWLLSTGQSPVQLAAEWYTSGGSLIQTNFGQPCTAPAQNAWQPVYVQLTSPSNAATMRLVAYVQNANAGDLEVIDLSYVSPAFAQVLIDWINSPIVSSGMTNNSGSSFMDCSPWLRLDTGISLQRGRQDSITEMSAGSATFALQNDTGVFSRFKSLALAGPVTGGVVTLQRRCQINATDETGTWYTRFDGPIAEIDYLGDNTGNTNVATVTCGDVLALLQRQDDLDSWTRELIRNDVPQWTWALDDAGNTGHYGQAAESSGNNGPAMRAFDKDTSGAATLTWQDSSAGVETLADAVAVSKPDGSEFWSAGQVAPNSPLRGLDSGTVGPYGTPVGSINVVPVFTSNPFSLGVNSYIGNNGYCLFTQLPQADILSPNATGDDFSAEIWFMPDTSGTAGGQCLSTAMTNATLVGPYIPLSLGNSRNGQCIVAGAFFNTTTAMKFEMVNHPQPPAFIGNTFHLASSPYGSVSAAWVPDRVPTVSGNNVVIAGGSLPHHLVMVCAGATGGGTITLWLDGQNLGSLTLQPGQEFDTIYVGSAFGGAGAWSGNLSMCSIYDYQLSPQQITNHCSMGQYGMWELATDNCIDQLADYANIPIFWSAMGTGNMGLSLTDYQDITGSNALTNMQTYEQTELGLLYVNSLGQLTLHTRDWRMGYGAPDMYLPPDTFDADMSLSILDQFMCNEAAGSTATYQTGAAYVNQASKDNYGDYSLSTLESPTELPYITWSRAYALLGLPNLAFWPDPNLNDYAAWLANSRADPYLIPGELTVDMLSPDVTAGSPKISQWYALDIDNMIAPSGTMPSSWQDVPLSTEWFIEGINETISNSSRVLTIYTSPAETQRCWIPGDATYGVLGVTTRIGVSAPDLNVVLVQSKDVSHDAGPPYVSFNTSAMAAGTLNNPAANGHDFVGATDIRSMYANLQQVMQPPLLVVGAKGNTQLLPVGANTAPEITWDTIYVDSENGMGAVNGWPNWYVVTVPGFYEIDASVEWSQSTATGSGQGWIVVAYEAAQGLAAGIATPLTGDTYVCPIGEQNPFNANADNNVQCPTVTMYLGVGDMVGVAAEQGNTAAKTTGFSYGGTKLSLRWISNSVYADRCQANTSISTGGSVTNPGLAVQQTFTYSNSATYLYYGQSTYKTSPGPNQRVNSNGSCWQGCATNGEKVTGSQYGYAKMPYSQMISDLSGCTILSTTLSVGRYASAANGFSANCNLMLGWTGIAAASIGAYTLKFNHTTDHPDLTYLQMPGYPGGIRVVSTIPNAFAQAFQSGGATCLTWGNNSTDDQEFYGAWSGGSGAWIMTVKVIV